MAAKAKKEIVKRPPRTLKERRFVKEYIANGGVATAAALKAYDTTSVDSAKRIGHEVVERLNITQLMEERERLTDQMLLNDLENGLESYKLMMSPTEGDKVVPDFSVRHKWWTSAMNLKGHLKEAGVTVNVVIPILAQQATAE